MGQKRAADRDGTDELLDALYAAPPRAFVAERKRVAAAFAAAGRREDARAAARLKRPSASVWAVNQLARRAPDELAALLALGARLRREERRLMRGGRAEGFMADARTARQQVASLAKTAESFVTELGQNATATLGRKIVQTLHAASIADDETRARLAAGRLRDDLAAPSTFGAGGDVAASLAASFGATATSARALRAAAPKSVGATDEPLADKLSTARGRAAAERHRRARGAADRERGATDRMRAAVARREQRRVQAAARKHAAALERAAGAAARVVADRARAVEQARNAVERAESELRAAKDRLVDAETVAAATRRAADEADAAR